jgi:hypothetical protein
MDLQFTHIYAVVVIVIRDVMCNDLVCLFAVDVMFKRLICSLRPHDCLHSEFPNSFRPRLWDHSSREWFQNLLMRSISRNEFAYSIGMESLHHMLPRSSFVFERTMTKNAPFVVALRDFRKHRDRVALRGQSCRFFCDICTRSP